MSNGSIQKIMTDNKELFTQLVGSGISNSELAQKFSEKINEVVSVPQVARFKREFGLIKATGRPPELVIEKRPRNADSLDRVMRLLFAKQIDVLEKSGVELKILEEIFEVSGQTMTLDGVNNLVEETIEELDNEREKDAAIAKLKSLGVGEKELIKLLKQS